MAERTYFKNICFRHLPILLDLGRTGRGGEFSELRQSDPHVRLARLGLYRGVGSLTVLEVARDDEQKSEDAQHGNPDPEIEHEIWQVFELLGAKWD
jgi:hypothetical protein